MEDRGPSASRFRFSLASLMGVILVVAIGCSVLRWGLRLWGVWTVFPTLGMLVLSLYRAKLGRDDDRLFWLGFALVGWVYFLIVVFSGPLNWHPAHQELFIPQFVWNFHIKLPWIHPMNLGLMFHSLATVLFALLGGILARRMFQGSNHRVKNAD